MMKIFTGILMLLAIYSCSNNQNESSVENARESLGESAGGDVVAVNVDSTVRPGDDFFMYANGRWLKNTSIPESESGWGIGYVVQDEIYYRLKNINEEAVKANAAPGTVTQKIGSFWKSGMDTVSINRQALSPLQADLDRIENIKNEEDLLTVASILKRKGINALFSDYVSQDDKNSEKMAFKLDQGGLGMPNRDYYFNTDVQTTKVRAAYKDYQFKTFNQLINDSALAEKKAEDVLALETRLAKSSRKLSALRDPYKNYNKMSLQKLQQLTAAINWRRFAAITGIENKTDTVIVGQPEYFQTLNREFKSTPIDTWKHYLKLRLVQSFANYLDTATYQNYFTYRKTLSGASVPRPRWKRVLDAEENAIGEALGQLFVKEYFSEAAKKRYNDIVENVRAAYRERIERLDWMSDSTKQRAYEKLRRITKKVGYPDKWKDFSDLKIDDGPWVLNMQRANEWWHNYEINKLGKPVDHMEWEMTPQTYNAYYNPSNNEIVLPAGIFTIPGFRDEKIDDAVVYGYAAASTVGHEITHGFDDQGRQYDAQGNLKNWWTKKDELEFSKRAQQIIRQFNEFNPVDTLHINGDATQGENIADLGGVLIGLDAFKKTDTYKKNEIIHGFTPLQRFFLGYALSWQYQFKDESLASQVMTDVHSPAKERVNGPLANLPEFHEAFNIKPGDKMYRPDSLRVYIW